MKSTPYDSFVCPICGTGEKIYFDRVLIVEEPSRKRAQLPIRRVVPRHFCPSCGFQWSPLDGDLHTCVKEYIKNHPIKSCLGVL